MVHKVFFNICWIQNSGYQPQAQKELTWTTFWMISVHNDMAPIQFQLQQMAWFCTPPGYILKKPRSPCQPPKVRFCTVHISAKKTECFRFCTGAIWYWDICGGSGPLLESCRPQLRVHKMVHKNHWECHFVHPQGAEKKPVRNEAHHVDLEWFGCVQNGLPNPQMQSLYKMGIVDLMLICVQNGSLVGCSKWGAPTLLHQSSWSQISLYKMWMTNP